MQENVLKQVESCWNQKAEGWNRHMGDEGDRNRKENIHRPMWALLGNVQGRTILDAGCGTGYLTSILCKKGAHVTGVDLSGEMIRIAKDNTSATNKGEGTIELRVDDCCQLKTLEDESFELIVSNYVLQDLPYLQDAVNAFARVLKKGGRAVVAFSHPCYVFPEWEKNGENYTLIQRSDKPYFEERMETETWRGTDVKTGERIDFEGEFIFFHRPLTQYFQSFLKAGFRVNNFLEPIHDENENYPGQTKENRKRALLYPYSVMFELEKV